MTYLQDVSAGPIDTVYVRYLSLPRFAILRYDSMRGSYIVYH